MIKIKFNDTIQFFTVGFSKSNNIITLTGNDIPQLTTGFKTYKMDEKPLGDFSEFKTVYRVLDDGVQFSNDGSIWVEPTRDVVVQAVWDDADDAEGLRPETVAVTVNGKVVMLEAVAWSITYEDIKESEVIEVTDAADIDGYDKTINGTTVLYHHDYIDPTPSLEERVYDLEVAVCEIADSIG